MIVAVWQSDREMFVNPINMIRNVTRMASSGNDVFANRRLGLWHCCIGCDMFANAINMVVIVALDQSDSDMSANQINRL